MTDFDPLEFFNIACNLAKGSNEGDHRSSINRAYYSVFLLARQQANLDSVDSAVHTKVLNHFEANDSRLHQRLKPLFALRKEADYERSKRIVQRNAEEALRFATYILKKLGKLPSA